MESLMEARIDVKEVLALASIDRKAREAGLLACAEKLRLNFWTYSAEELQAVEGEFTGSDFVKKQVGVDNVCERAALRACEDTMQKEGAGEERSKEAAREKPETKHTAGRLLCRKRTKEGMTLAIARREWRISLDE